MVELSLCDFCVYLIPSAHTVPPSLLLQCTLTPLLLLLLFTWLACWSRQKGFDSRVHKVAGSNPGQAPGSRDPVFSLLTGMTSIQTYNKLCSLSIKRTVSKESEAIKLFFIRNRLNNGIKTQKYEDFSQIVCFCFTSNQFSLVCQTKENTTVNLIGRTY